MGSVFLTFGSRQDAEEFFRNRHRHLIFKGRKLQAKWQRDFFRSRAEFNDDLDEEAIEKTVYISGFDKLVRSLNQPFLRFLSLSTFKAFKIFPRVGDKNFSKGLPYRLDTYELLNRKNS